MNNNCLRTPPMDNIYHIYFTQMLKQLRVTKMYFKTHQVKHSHSQHVMFILKHALFILNYKFYHFKQLVYIMKFWLRKKCQWNYVQGIMEHSMVLWMVLMGFLKILQKLFQNLLFGYIFIIFRSHIIHELKIYKSMMNS